MQRSVEIDDLQIQRDLVDMRTGESGFVDGGNLTLQENENVFIGNNASSGESAEGEGQSVGLERRGTVHDAEMEVRRIAVARIAEQPENLAGDDLVARLDPQAARLEMGVEGKASAADIDDDVVAAGDIKRTGTSALPP